ncbi:MAG: NifB/NifX family molybdenum-iron cluster-binding protein [Myxococcota bacterium]|jgi:predicted Fe-Mo cluster-binding NifX family protein|nr:NifB/NifX family molybdenum-iron cluster-binding protein [Myxococcota bacterium]
MRIAISATSASLDAAVDPRFGRCAFLLFVELPGLEFEAVENANVALGGGAGIQTAQLVASKGASALLTGACGPNAHQTLSAAGIELYVDCQGSVRNAIAGFEAGELSKASGPNVRSHAGMGAKR